MEAALTNDVNLIDIQDALEEALWRYEPVRTASRDIKVKVSAEGRVEVSGRVRSGLIKDGILDILRYQPGVQEIVDGVIADPDIELAVARKLAEDERTRSLSPGSVQVFSHLGTLTLVGRLPADVARERVVETVREVPGVENVIDRLS